MEILDILDNDKYLDRDIYVPTNLLLEMYNDVVQSHCKYQIIISADLKVYLTLDNNFDLKKIEEFCNYYFINLFSNLKLKAGENYIGYLNNNTSAFYWLLNSMLREKFNNRYRFKVGFIAPKSPCVKIYKEYKNDNRGNQFKNWYSLD